ncbi:carbohydrate kinase [Streptomyces sp. WAC06614]|nr:carbohydrate kinase [Streptomyces sp. WAC06614]
MTTRIILGIDAGTTSVKTVAFTLDGEIVGAARAGVPVDRGPNGEAEVDMERVWEATASTVKDVVDQLTACGGEVAAIGVTGQGDGLWLVDDEGRPVRPAALWLDGRTAARLADWDADGRSAAVARTTGSPLFPGAMPILVAELAAAGAIPDPASTATGVHQLNCKDWLRYRLTGVMVTDPSESSRTYLDTRSVAYEGELFARLGHDAVRRWLPDVADPGAVAGGLTEHAAAVLGLAVGTPVAVGLVDAAAAGVGIGAVADGTGYAILGTTGFVGVNHPSRADVRMEQSIVLATGRGSQVIESLAPMTGTPNLDWVRECLGRGHQDWSEIERAAAAVPPGSGGLLYLPYGSPSGERAPFSDSAASAAWLGMSITTTSAELLRSVYEGLAYALTECLDALRLDGSLAICGGGSDSDLFCRILADVSGRRIVRQDAPEVGARGAATLAGVAAGVFDDLDAGVTGLAPTVSHFLPRPEHHALYAQTYEAFIDTRDALRPRWAPLRALRALTPVPARREEA